MALCTRVCRHICLCHFTFSLPEQKEKHCSQRHQQCEFHERHVHPGLDCDNLCPKFPCSSRERRLYLHNLLRNDSLRKYDVRLISWHPLWSFSNRAHSLLTQEEPDGLQEKQEYVCWWGRWGDIAADGVFFVTDRQLESDSILVAGE